MSLDPNWIGSYYEGIGSIMTVLKRAGHNTSLLQVIKLLDDKDVLDFVDNDTDLVAFSTTTNMFPLVQKWSSLLKKHYPNIPLLCGGNHPTLAPKETLQQSVLDWACVGEGEKFILALADYLQNKRALEDISSLVYRKESKIIVNQSYLAENNLDTLPVVDRTLFADHITKSSTPEVFTSRGCPYSCTFCCNEAKKLTLPNPGKYLRFFSPQRVIETLLEIKKNSKIEYFMFIDDVFGVNLKWLKEFSIMYNEQIKLPFKCEMDPRYIREEVIEILADMGCISINMGLQSGDEHIRNNVMKRNMSLERVKKSIEICKKNNIETKIDIIFGTPTETKQQVIRTVDLLAQLDVNHAKTHIFYPFPYTELEVLTREMGLIETNKFNIDYFSGSILKYSKAHKRIILFMHVYSDKIVQILKPMYKSNSFIVTLFRKIFMKVIFSSIFIHTTVLARKRFLQFRAWYRKIRGLKALNYNNIETW